MTEDNPFREAARRSGLLAEAPDLSADNRDRLWRRARWYEEQAAAWDLRRGIVPQPRQAPEDLPRRIPGQSWEALTGERLAAHRGPTWNPDEHSPTLHRMVAALHRRPP